MLYQMLYRSGSELRCAGDFALVRLFGGLSVTQRSMSVPRRLQFRLRLRGVETLSLSYLLRSALQEAKGNLERRHPHCSLP
jgi:hypothetical protein